MGNKVCKCEFVCGMCVDVCVRRMCGRVFMSQGVCVHDNDLRFQLLNHLCH